MAGNAPEPLREGPSFGNVLWTAQIAGKPPVPLWLQTHEDIASFCMGPGIGCQGSLLVGVDANGSPGFAQYKPRPGGGRSRPAGVLKSAWTGCMCSRSPDCAAIPKLVRFWSSSGSS